MKKEKPIRRFLITAAISAVITLLVLYNRGYFSAVDASSRSSALSDAFFVPGILIIGVALLAFVSDDGMFDIFGYSFLKFKGLFKRSGEKDDGTPKTFFDYRSLKHSGKRAGLLHLFVIGGTDLLCAAFFLLISGNF